MKSKLLLGALVALMSAGGAMAQSAGSIVVYGGGAQITPHVDSGDLTAPSLPGTKVDVKKASQVVGGVVYMWTDNIGIDLPIGPGYKHKVVGAGAIADVGKLGTVSALPVTLLAHYRFGEATSTVRPYLGAGVTYARFFKPISTASMSGITGGTPANPTLLTMKSTGGPTAIAGVVVNVTGNWSVDLAVTKTFLKTTGSLSTGQTIETTLDPTSVKFGIGYKF